MASIADHQIQKLEAEHEIKCSALEFYGLFTHNVHQIPKYVPQIYSSVETIGDGIGLGTIFVWNYIHEGRSLVCKERVTAVDNNNMSMTYSVYEGVLLNDYKSFDFKLAITPNKSIDGMSSNSSSLVKWTLVYEKANDNVPPPTYIMEFLDIATREVEDKLCKQ